MDDIYAKSLALHKRLKGKIEVSAKAELNNLDDLALLYTPGVAEASRVIGRDREQVWEYTGRGNMVYIVTDGSAVLGLGDLGGEAALPVMEGKAVLFKKFANIDAVPICLNTKDVNEIVHVVKAISPGAGAVNLEDISAPRCFEIEERLRAELTIPIMHDDQHGTATIVLAGLINALKATNRGEGKDVRIVVNGAGAAGNAIVRILCEYGFTNIIVCDSTGVIYKERPDLTMEKVALALLTNHTDIKGTLADALVGADVFVGVSRGDILKVENIQAMNKDSIVFALSNPVPEVMPDVAKAGGAAVVSTGRSDFPNQVNNALAYPGIFRGALDNKIAQFTPQMFVSAALALASLVENPTTDKILPDIFDERIVPIIAKTFANPHT